MVVVVVVVVVVAGQTEWMLEYTQTVAVNPVSIMTLFMFD